MEFSDNYTLSVAIPRPLDSLFTYKLPEHLRAKVQVGGWVKVPFGRSTTHAFIVEPPKIFTGELAGGLKWEALKEIIEIGKDDSFLPEDVFSLCKWASEYYFTPLGEVLHSAVPAASLGLKTRGKVRALSAGAPSQPVHALNHEQLEALERLEKVRAARSGVALLHGVTGSGKTELYIELAKRTLQENLGVIIMVPEIALTSQLHRRVEEGLGTKVGLWHSALADGARRDQSAALKSGELKIIVGARSAVFAPVKDLGLMVVDEEHDPTYKQEDRFRYQARDLAVVRGKMSPAAVILGSATPSLESRERVIEKKYGLAKITQRIAVGGLPEVEIVDLLNEEKVPDVQAVIATRTLESIKKTLAAGEQVMVFLNRRGFAAFLLCEDCGEVTPCPHCSISLTVHRRDRQLRCHVCGHRAMIPDFCPKCQGADLRPVGAGTESLEEELPKLLANAKILRLDRDQITSTKRLDAVLEKFRSGQANLLLGTQMLVKGHDFAGVTLVVVMMADSLFRWPDFRASERALQVLKQVSGRAGRGDRPGRVMVQTFDPDHPVIQVLKGDLSEDSFLNAERELRRTLSYPPFGRLARIRFESPTQKDAELRAQMTAQILAPSREQGVDILGPSEAFLERAKGIFRWDLLLRSSDVNPLHRAVMRAKENAAVKKWSMSVDIDPYSIG